MDFVFDDQFNRVFPLVRDWIDRILAETAPVAKPVATFNFPRLCQYYSAELLARAKVVLVDKCPVPPLSSFGLGQFEDFENMHPEGITYLDTYFVRRPLAVQESLHFHELVHVVQWQILGVERFLALYAGGLETESYRDSPLEVMAYNQEARFRGDTAPYAVETELRQQLQAWL